MKEAWMNKVGHITGGAELNPVRISFPTSGAQQQTLARGRRQSPDDPVCSRGERHGQASGNTRYLNAIIPNPYSINALPTVQI